ncbi:MAG TPA: hypothetical protein PKH86_04990 [Candidatus Fermentibacter daniensis]|nr:hypothetical protein [Candidatus Fermentibacter daniensis]
MKHDVFLRKHPVFTGEELAKHLASCGEVGGRAQEAFLAYRRKTGRVVRVRRGLYAVIPPGADSDSYPVDPFLVAAKLTPDSVLSHHTALQLHGKAHSVHTHITYSASRPLGLLTFRSHVFRGTRFQRTLLRTGKVHAGVSIKERAGMELRVASLERTLVDVLDRPALSGSWEEIWRSLESVEFFDLDKVVEYALLLGNATTVAKVGFFLEQHRDRLMVEDRHLKALHDLRPRQPHYLDRARRESGCFVSKWNLMVPREVLERAWGEVL